ncbi:MAG: phosphate ABC transporter, permease protein PstA, partial [Methanosarcinaceae archaeon]|nr:phosphate ABC transporter, permease protein PstA [Methanosarcinaceae archaeon]
MRLKPTTTEKIAFGFLTIAITTVVAFVFLILYYITSNGIGAISIDFLTNVPLKRMTEGGIYPAIIGTLLLITGSMTVALPLGILAAVYLNEYAREGKLTWTIQMAISNLAGTPSVVFGLFGLALFVKYMGFG